MSGADSYCTFCDHTFYDKNEYKNHCQGKKHRANEKNAQLFDSAKRTVFVKGFAGQASRCKEMLNSYFSKFGQVNQITLNNKYVGFVSANVEYKDAASVRECLNTRCHFVGNFRLHVKQYVYQPSRSEMFRMIQQQNEREEKKKREQTNSHVKDLLKSASNLMEQIHQVCESLKLTEEDENNRAAISAELTKLLSKYFENCSVHEFGSSINRFGTKGCDLDLFLLISSDHSGEHKPTIALPEHKDLKTLKFDSGPLTAEQLSMVDLYEQVKLIGKIMSCRSKVYSDIITIPSQRCPVIKFTHSSGIKCDLSLNNRKGLYNSLLLRLYASEPRVRGLVSIVRLWVKAHSLGGAAGKNQMLTSYALTLMVLFYLMRREPKVIPLVCDLENCVKGTEKITVEGWDCILLSKDAELPPSENPETIVALLKGYFKYFAESINWETDVLMMRDGTVANKANVLQDPLYVTSKVGSMMLFDPFVLTHNVLGNVNENVKAKFMQEIKRAAELTENWPCDGALGSLDKPWGLAELFTSAPDPPDKDKGSANKGKGQKSQVIKQSDHHVSKIEGQQDNGEFYIPLQPKSETMFTPKLQAAAKEKGVTLSMQWCCEAHTMVVNILEKVFLVVVTHVECGGDDSSSHASKPPDKATSVTCNKRTSGEAKLEPQSPVDNKPMKRFCDGIKTTDGSRLTLEPVTLNDFTQPAHHPSLTGSIPDPDSTDHNLDSCPTTKYVCQCKHKMWLGRSRLKKNHTTSANLGSLALEMEISSLLLQEVEKLAQKVKSVELSHNKGSHSSPPIHSAVVDSREQDVEFTCHIQHMNVFSELPYILIRLKPLPACLNSFKNFYTSFRSMASRIIVSDLFQV